MEKYTRIKSEEYQAKRPSDEAKMMVRMDKMDKEVIALYTGLTYEEVDAFDNEATRKEVEALYTK